MMKYFRTLFPLFLGLFFFSVAKAQEKKEVYFFVDTLHVSKENRFVEIGNNFELTYTFYCKCVDNKKDIKFAFLQNKKGRETLDAKPKVHYISWKELLTLVDNNPRKFLDKYDLYITEALPNGRFRHNKITITSNPEKTYSIKAN